jgi:peptide/nickel transport system permease protein
MKRSRGLYDFLQEFRKSKSGLVGLAIIIVFVAISVYATIRYPYSEVLTWNDPRYWSNYPPTVPPTWVQALVGKDLLLDFVSILEKFIASDLNVFGSTDCDALQILAAHYRPRPATRPKTARSPVSGIYSKLITS